MKIKNLFFYTVIALAMLACDNESFDSLDRNETSTIVLKERDANTPLVLSNKKKRTKNSKLKIGSTLTFDKYLGRSYKAESLPIGSIEDMGYPVVDIEKLIKDHPNYSSTMRIGIGEASSFSYSNFSRYLEKSKVTKKVKGGFSLNLGLFSIGAKRKMEKVFTTSKIEERNRVFGELNIQFKEARYVLQSSSNISNKISLNYVTGEFKDELYNSTPSELCNNYGRFVLSDFIVGGRTTALYSGIHRNNSQEETKEKNMSKDISASYGFKMKSNADGKVSADFGIGKGFTNGSSSSNKITSLETSIKTTGGSLAFTSFTIPKSIDNINIDLAGWVESLNDKSSHAIIDIVDNGLIPLSDFILEENLRRHYDKYYVSGVDEVKLIEPCVKILRQQTADMCLVRVYLVTRFGDMAIIDGAQFPSFPGTNQLVEQFKTNMIKKYSAIYGVKFIYKEEYNNEITTVNSSFCGPKGTDMKKFINAKNNTMYLLYSKNGEKYAFSIHDDYILDTYAMREFVEQLPSVQINSLSLLDYTIIAL